MDRKIIAMWKEEVISLFLVYFSERFLNELSRYVLWNLKKKWTKLQAGIIWYKLSQVLRKLRRDNRVKTRQLAWKHVIKLSWTDEFNKISIGIKFTLFLISNKYIIIYTCTIIIITFDL